MKTCLVVRAALFPVFALVVLLVGCTTERHVTDAHHPDVAITADGGVTYRGKFVDARDLPGLLKDSGFTKQDTINIHVPEDIHNMREPRRVMAILSRNGFTRPILVSDRKSYTALGKTEDERRLERRRWQQEQMRLPPEKRTIRYK